MTDNREKSGDNENKHKKSGMDTYIVMLENRVNIGVNQGGRNIS